MALVKCRDCGAEVSTTAATCTKCGAKQPRRTSPAAWFVACLFLAIMLISIFQRGGSGTARTACKPLDPALLGLPTDKREAQADFIAKAERLRASGKCVIEGNFGRAYDKYYFAIDRDGQPKNYYFERFTRDELKR